MKFENNSKSAKLEESWCSKIANNFMDKMPIITKLPKDGEKSDIRFRGLSRLINLASTICQVSHTRFKHPGEVHRAAHYIGMNILFNMYGMEKKDKGYGAKLYAVIQANEKYRTQCILLDDVLTSVRDVMKAARDGVMNMPEQKEKLDELVDAMPKELKKLTINKIKELRDGKNITELYENVSRGGDRKSK